MPKNKKPPVDPGRLDRLVRRLVPRVDLYLVKRRLRYWWQRLTRGFDDSETWSLSGTIAVFALPRLKRLRELHSCHPTNMTMEEWDATLDDMIYAMDICAAEDVGGDCDWDRVQRGLDAFGSKFRELWW